MRKSMLWLIFRSIGVLVLLWLGIFWLWLVRPSDRAWYDIPLGLVCLAMAGRDLVNVIRGLRARKRGRQTEDDPQQP